VQEVVQLKRENSDLQSQVRPEGWRGAGRPAQGGRRRAGAARTRAGRQRRHATGRAVP
jgi:hypothetical protein